MSSSYFLKLHKNHQIETLNLGIDYLEQEQTKRIKFLDKQLYQNPRFKLHYESI